MPDKHQVTVDIPPTTEDGGCPIACPLYFITNMALNAARDLLVNQLAGLVMPPARTARATKNPKRNERRKADDG